MNKKFLNILIWSVVALFLISCNQQSNNTEILMENEFVIIGATAGENFVREYDSNLEEDNLNEDFNILYYCEEKVMNSQLFADFLNNKCTAYDNIDDSNYNVWSINDLDFNEEYYENKIYIKDVYQAYYNKYGEDLIGVQVRSIDLNQDEKDELIIIIEYNDYGVNNGNLHVFHEEEGVLYAWESWRNILEDRFSIGIFEKGGITSGGLFAKYNDEGYIEVIYLGSWITKSIEPDIIQGHYYEREIWYQQNIMHDEDGTIKEYVWEEKHIEQGEPVVTHRDQMIKDESNELCHRLYEAQGMEKYIPNLAGIEDKKTISLEELL